MVAPVKPRNAVAVGIGTHQDHRAMETKTLSSACLLLGFAFLCGLQKTQGYPSVDPPLLPTGLRRSVEPSSAEYDEFDVPQGPLSPPEPAPAASPVGPSLNPLLPLIRMKPGKLGPVVDPSQFIQMKADLLKNLFGPGGAKGPVTRAASSGPSKWAGGAAWASGSGAPGEKWGASSKSKPTKAPKPAPNPAQPKPWDWPPPTSAPAAPAAPQAPAWASAPASWASAPASWAPAPAAAAPAYPPPAPYPQAPVSAYPSVPGYWIPTSVIPTPTEPVDKKSVLLEALLDQLISQPTEAPASRFARAPVADPSKPTPSPYLADLLNSFNLTLPDAPLSLKPTIEPPGFWFPSYVPAPPGSLTPFAVDPSAQIAKKTKFLSDLFASKAAANAAAASAAASPSTLAAKGVDPAEYSTKVSAYLNNLLDSTTTTSKRAAVVPKKSKAAKSSKGTKPTKVSVAATTAAPTNPPIEEETPEDEVALDQLLGLRKKRDIEDETEADETPEDETAPETPPEADAAAQKAKTTAALLNDLAVIKDSILVELDAMSKTESATSKAAKAAAKAAKKGSSLAALLNLPAPTPAPVSTSAITDHQQKIALLTSFYKNLTDTYKNITSAPDANDPLNADNLFIAAVNAKVNKILLRAALIPTTPKVARSNNSNWQRWRGQQDADSATQYEADSETSSRQKSAVPLVAAVFAPQTHHYQQSRQPWWN